MWTSPPPDGQARGSHDYLSEAVRIDPLDAFSFDERAMSLWALGDKDKAVTDIQEAVRLNPHHAGFRSNLAARLVENGDYANAIKHCNEALRIDPNGARTYSVRGYAHEGLKQFELALSDYTAAIRLNPRKPTYWQDRSSLHRIMVPSSE